MDSLTAKALAFRRSATHDGLTVTANARQAYRDSFAKGHGPCSMCGPAIVLPDDLSPAERVRRSVALRKMHYANLGARASRARRRVS